jgi:hypothetical protein
MIIGISGPAGCGKSTAAQHLVNEYGFVRRRFAGPLKAMCAALGLDHDHIEGGLKEKPSPLLCGKSPRYAMQTLGTEWGRNLIGQDVWVNAWRASLPSLESDVVAEDVRFENEALAIEAVGGFVIHINGRGGIEGEHESEGYVHSSAIHIGNGGDIWKFYQAIDGLVFDLKRHWLQAA